MEIERREAKARALRLKQEEEERRRLQEAALLKKQQEEEERRQLEEAERRRKEQDELRKVGWWKYFPCRKYQMILVLKICKKKKPSGIFKCLKYLQNSIKF